MDILYCGDGNITDGVLISVLSLLKNSAEPLHIYLLTASINTKERQISAISDDFADFLDGVVKEKNVQNSVTLLDITDKFNAELPVANMATRFTPCCMLRLYCDKIESLPDWLLYLDNDVICRLDPADFYNQDMTDFELAGTLDYYGSWFFYNKFPRRDYLNSGVLLLNLSKIRQTGLFEKCRKMCREKQMFMPDQSAINKLCRLKKICDRQYNEQRKLKNDTVFQHFTTSFRFLPYFHAVSVKPWNIDGMHNTLKLYEYDGLLNEYSNLKEKVKL